MNSSIQPHVLREYALVADGERGALIGLDGVIAWLCAPRWDSPAAFSGLLGGPGRYAITSSDPCNAWGAITRPAASSGGAGGAADRRTREAAQTPRGVAGRRGRAV